MNLKDRGTPIDERSSTQMKSRSKFSLKKALSAVAAVAIAGTALPLLSASPAQAAGTQTGPALIRAAGGGNTQIYSGTGATNFNIYMTDTYCPGNSIDTNDLIQTYMVPETVDPATLTFGADGPLPNGTGAAFSQPLYDVFGTPYANGNTSAASTPGGPGGIFDLPDIAFNFEVYTPADLLPGVYNVGVACTRGPAGPSQLLTYWNTKMTFTSNPAGGNAQVSWTRGEVPAAPVLTAVNSGDGSLSAVFTHAGSEPPTSGFTATATPTAGGAPVIANGATSPIAIPGLTNGAEYSVTVRATNAVGNSPESNALLGTPSLAALPAVQNLTATPGTGMVDLNWDAPTGPTPTGYSVEVSPAEGTVTPSGTSASVTGLTAGTSYLFTVTPTHAAPNVGTPASVSATPFASQVVVGALQVVRPTGAVVLTQVCGKNGPIPAETVATDGFPVGSLPAIPAVGPGTMPTGETAAQFDQYPYPENADGTPAPTYPTSCGINLDTAKFIKKGPGAGKFFAAKGVLSQITVVDTRDTDTGWAITGTMGAFTAGTGKSFSGSQLGWTPEKTSDTEAFVDSDDNSYDQVVLAGDRVDPNTPNATGLSSGRNLGTAAGLAEIAPKSFTGGLGIAELDARLKLLIPVTAKSGTYNGTLTLTVTGA